MLPIFFGQKQTVCGEGEDFFDASAVFFVDHSPKLRVLIIAIGDCPEMAQI